MITHLSLDNFQSWRTLDMELAPVTVVVGRGNTGKSAIVRALLYALTNKGGDDFIRRGAPKTTVAMAINGHELTWTKARNKGGEYTLDNVTFTKTGQTVPEEIREATGFRPVEVEKGYSIMPNIHTQFEQPFLVFDSGSRVARVLGKLTKVDVIVSAQMAAKRDLKDAQTALAGEKKNVEEQERFLRNLPDAKELRDEYDQVRQAVQTAESLDRLADNCEAALRTFGEAAGACVDYAGLAEKCTQARTAVANADTAERAWERYTRAVAGYADAALVLDRATEELELHRGVYITVCEEAGVCEECPWKL